MINKLKRRAKANNSFMWYARAVYHAPMGGIYYLHELDGMYREMKIYTYPKRKRGKR